MRISNYMHAMLSMLYLQTVIGKANGVSKPLCPGPNGAFVGMSVDKDAYFTVSGSAFAGDDHNGPSGPQEWTLTAEKANGPTNSFEGKFLQVLPDSGRSYPGSGKQMKNPKDLEGNSPYVSFILHVPKERAGWHILFVRWTGGDTVGGGDSFFVTLYKIKGSRRFLVKGERTVKPSVVPITSEIHKYAGCCYDMVTHACPCHEANPNDNLTCANFINKEKASSFGAQCLLGPGIMDIVEDPRWYLFAGQEAGDVMDFNSEPWDVTCEAEGSNTKDSGHDFPSWELGGGDYELRLYAREDGTALDAIYVAGPGAPSPDVTKLYQAGDSTICEATRSRIVLYVGFALGFILLAAFFFATPIGQDLWHSFMRRLALDDYRIDMAQATIRQYEGIERLETIG